MRGPIKTRVCVGLPGERLEAHIVIDSVVTVLNVHRPLQPLAPARRNTRRAHVTDGLRPQARVVPTLLKEQAEVMKSCRRDVVSQLCYV